MKLIRGGHFEFQLNLENITWTYPYLGKCEISLIISDFKFFRPQKLLISSVEVILNFSKYLIVGNVI